MSYKTIVSHLRTLSKTALQTLLNKNPSYIFFVETPEGPTTTLGTQAIGGRTIATDPTYFPKGAIAFLQFRKPIRSPQGAIIENVEQWPHTSRLVIDQDTGGAIRGPNRLDLFWGQGEEAAELAGYMKQWGKLYYLVPR